MELLTIYVPWIGSLLAECLLLWCMVHRSVVQPFPWFFISIAYERRGVATIQAICDEADDLRSALVRALFLLKFRSRAAEGKRLLLDATSRYVSVLRPALKELHNRRSETRERIPIFEIHWPKQCEGWKAILLQKVARFAKI